MTARRCRYTCDVGNVGFPRGYTILPDGDTLHIYYGAADTSIALATGSITAMLDWLERDGALTSANRL